MNNEMLNDYLFDFTLHISIMWNDESNDFHSKITDYMIFKKC